MTDIINGLLDNLSSQQAAMLRDDIGELQRLTAEQEGLAVRLKALLDEGTVPSDEQRAQMMELNELADTNRLLARQSVNFARRMLKALGQEQGYGEDGKPLGQQQSKTRVDIRA
jgi:hypothetical protein